MAEKTNQVPKAIRVYCGSCAYFPNIGIENSSWPIPVEKRNGNRKEMLELSNQTRRDCESYRTSLGKEEKPVTECGHKVDQRKFLYGTR
jgi:ribosomal protein L44E